MKNATLNDGLEAAMAQVTQQIKIKCPHCGWVRALDLSAYEDLSKADIVAGWGQALRAAYDRVRAACQDSALQEANAWILMPNCPHCDKPYRYNVRTRETKP